MDIKILKDLFQLTIERGNLLQSQDQIILRNMVHLSLLKCGKVEMESMIDQGDLSKILGNHWKKLILFVKNIFSAEPRILEGTYFPKVRRMLLYFSLLIFGYFWPPILKCLKRWGYADEVHLGKSFRAKDFGLECQRDVQRLL